MIRARADDADFQSMPGMPASKRVNDVNPFAGIEIVDGALAVDVENLFVHGKIQLSPPHVLFGIRFLDDPLILRRASRLGAGIGNESARISDGRTGLVTNGVLVKQRGGRIAKDSLDGDAA